MSKAYFINKVLATTVVGSYPVVKAGGFKSIFDPLAGAVETAVSDQIGAGIDIISDGQVRGDMIGEFRIQTARGQGPGSNRQDPAGGRADHGSGHEVCPVEIPRK